jgi:hypothetical protein
MTGVTEKPWYQDGNWRVSNEGYDAGWSLDYQPADGEPFTGTTSVSIFSGDEFICGVAIASLHRDDLLDQRALLISQAPATARALDECREALTEAPILSKYHGYMGFEVERFIADYEAWTVKRRAALAKGGL